MAKKIEFYFDYVSPATYLAYTQLPLIAERTGSEIIYKPFLLGGVMNATGNSPPMSVPAKGAWLIKDLTRCAARYGVPFTLNPHFPFNTVQLMRGAVWAKEQGNLDEYNAVIFKAMWAEEKNLTDLSVLAELLESIDINPDEFGAVISAQEIKDKLRTNTDEAVSRGAFGAPTMYVGEEMFWGQDRLDYLEEELNK